MDDMKKMKSSHVKVIDRIQDQYKSVEDDIQVFTWNWECFNLLVSTSRFSLPNHFCILRFLK